MWREFFLDTEFQWLYKNPGSPIVQECARLQKSINDLNINDPVKLATLKGQLYGLQYVYRAVEAQAESETTAAQTAAEEKVQPPLGRYSHRTGP